MEPGQASYLLIEPEMHEGMDGAHLFEITVQTDSPIKPVHKLNYRAFFGSGAGGVSH